MSETLQKESPQGKILTIIRETILDNMDHMDKQIDILSEKLNVSPAKASELLFRFYFFPTEEFINKCLSGEHTDKFSEEI